jgi:Tol biopolymer transport system component
LLDERDVPEFTVEKQPFLYDLYKIPFNDGKGGTPERLAGASNNGMSNYFPKYSPDGKWIVFTKSKTTCCSSPTAAVHISIEAASRDACATTPRA